MPERYLICCCGRRIQLQGLYAQESNLPLRQKDSFRGYMRRKVICCRDRRIASEAICTGKYNLLQRQKDTVSEALYTAE